VSTNDIANEIKEFLRMDDEASRIMLDGGNVRFAKLNPDVDRVKSLGRFEVAISVVSGASTDRSGVEPVRKVVEVVAEE
jgi:hypothetical protein